MAKSVRSKSQRKNRAHLRATVYEPIVKKRLEAITASLEKSIKDKKETPTLTNLKNILPSAQINKENENEDNEQMNEDDSEDENNNNNKSSKQEPNPNSNKTIKRNRFFKEKAIKSSKNSKPQRELFWFKNE